MISIDMKDFIPEPIEGDIYEGFEMLVEKANSWLEELSGVLHVSLQSVLVQKGDSEFILLFQKIKSLLLNVSTIIITCSLNL